MQKPKYIFETSWEVCNKVGGIHTVVSTKARSLLKEYNDRLIMIGPDVWRDTNRANPEFEEDTKIFANWRRIAKRQGLNIKIGRWKVVGKPLVILVDFSNFIIEKDNIFRQFWEEYQLDSLSGQWDYIEPMMFGYAAGKVVESFAKYNINYTDKVVAHFHEWMTGSGILYLRTNAPQIATAFTTHATAVGRSIAGNGQKLYRDLKTFNGDQKAKEFNIISKQSIEKISAQVADVFTTVSEITAEECTQFHEKSVDIVTPNGFEDGFVPNGDDYTKKQSIARKKLIDIAEKVLGYSLNPEIKIVGTSGRYEFQNKGLDVFLDALKQFNENTENQEMLAFVLVPAHNYGARKDLQELLANTKTEHNGSRYLTHNLHDAEYDPVLNKIAANGLTNDQNQRMKVIFVPSYLNGDDGIFNLPYYDILIGLNVTVFASYYEPWGYTPLESLAFSIPTVTTTLAGFGKWILSRGLPLDGCMRVIERDDENYQQVVSDIAMAIETCNKKSDQQQNQSRQQAFEISRIALWENLVEEYYKAYDIALSKIQLRADELVNLKQTEDITTKVKKYKSNKPIWRNIFVQPNLTGRLKGLNEMAKNIWWSWNYEACDMFEYIDPQMWHGKDSNPVAMLKEISYERFTELEKDEYFLKMYDKVYKNFIDYMKQAENPKPPSVAYFSMEYGMANVLKIYSGGLGILAGDYLKEASDNNIDLVAMGFLYRFGYFTQQLSLNGEQQVNYESQDFNNLPLEPVKAPDGSNITVQVAFPGRTVVIQAWLIQVGRIELYLLDTDLPENRKEDRYITHHLYGGDNENRLKQEMVLGIGGIRMLEALDIHKKVYHLNEGHAALIGVERVHQYMRNHSLSYNESVEIVRGSSLFTTHTPVPAGHDTFPEELIMTYMGHYPERLYISWEEFVNLGKIRPGDKHEKFSMSHLAANLSQEINGVSMLHGEVTKDMFNKLWEAYYPQELHIGYVTNGVHYYTWTSKLWRKLYEREFGNNFLSDMSNKGYWHKIYKIDDQEIWKLRQTHRRILVDYIKHRIDTNWIKRREDPKSLLAIKNNFDEKALTIGFARRFATYKRGNLLFRNLERLAKLVNDAGRPVQFLFAGKAHPADGGGQGIIKQIVEISKRPEFIGKIIFLENYDIALARKLVQGVDIWLNTPTRPLEASGTSGMKAVLNGVMNFSVLDGWWVEGFNPNAGWALDQKRVYDNQEFQDALDVETIYQTLENEIIPMFYSRNEKGVPVEWVQRIKTTIADIAPTFTTKRMMDDYIDRFYTKLQKRSELIHDNDFEKAIEIANWKKKIARGWDSIEIVNFNFSDPIKDPLVMGEKYYGEIVLDLKELNDTSIGLEIIMTEQQEGGYTEIVESRELELMRKDGSIAYYEIEMIPSKPGSYQFGFRLFPKNDLLPHRQDFSYVKWI